MEMQSVIRSSWPPQDVVAKLIEATRILLDDHSYDGQGHEALRIAERLATEWLESRPHVLQTITVNPDGTVEFSDFVPPPE